MATDRTSSEDSQQHSEKSTVSPLKLPQRTKSVVQSSMDNMPLLKQSELHPCKLTTNVSGQPDCATAGPAVVRRPRGRPKGSKNRTPTNGFRQRAGIPQRSVNGSGTPFKRKNVVRKNSYTCIKDNEEPTAEEKSSDNAADNPVANATPQVFWQPPSDPCSRRLLERISITDVTANSLTITVRESTTDDGFFRSCGSDVTEHCRKVDNGVSQPML
jgi:hypothetical protein